MRDLAQPVSTEDRIAKNTEYAKQLLEKGVSHGREIATIAAKTGTEAAEVLQKRATEGLDEFRTCRNGHKPLRQNGRPSDAPFR